MTSLVILSIIALIICAIFIFLKFFKKYPLNRELIAEFDEEKQIVTGLICSTEQEMSLAPSDHLKQLNEIKKKFQEIVRSAEVVIDLNNKNFESSLKTNIANIKLIKTRIEFSLISYKIVAGLNACSDTLNKTSAGMKRSIETLKKIDSSQHPLAIIPKPATQIPKKHSTLHGVPDPERIEKTTTPKQIGPTGIVPRSPDLTSKIPDDPKNDPA